MDNTLSATAADPQQDTESPLRNKVKKVVIAMTRTSLKKSVFAAVAVSAISGGIVATGAATNSNVAHAAAAEPLRVGWTWRQADGSIFGVCPDGYHAEFAEVPMGTTEARYWVAADKNNLSWKTHTNLTYDQVQALIKSGVIVKPTQYGYERNVDPDGSGPIPAGVELVPATQADLKLDATYEGDCIINGQTIPGPYNTGSLTDIVPGDPVTTPVPVETPAPTTDPTTPTTPVETPAPTTPVETPAPTTEPTTPVETPAPTTDPTTPVETPAPTTDPTPVETPKPTTPVETAPPAKPVPTPKPAPVKMVARTFQLDKAMVRTAAAANKYAALDNDGVLNYREFAKKDWRHLCEKVEFLKVTVPANATKAQLIKAINAKSRIGDISTTAKLDKLPARKFVVQAWEMNPRATVKAPFGARKNLAQVYIGRSSVTNR